MEDYNYLGVKKENIKCRFCEDPAKVFKTGSVEVDKGKVVSVRVYFLCENHQHRKDFEKSLDY